MAIDDNNTPKVNPVDETLDDPTSNGVSNREKVEETDSEGIANKPTPPSLEDTASSDLAGDDLQFNMIQSSVDINVLPDTKTTIPQFSTLMLQQRQFDYRVFGRLFASQARRMGIKSEEYAVPRTSDDPGPTTPKKTFVENPARTGPVVTPPAKTEPSIKTNLMFAAMTATATTGMYKALSTTHKSYMRKSLALNYYQASLLRTLNQSVLKVGQIVESKLEAIKLNTAAPAEKKSSFADKVNAAYDILRAQREARKRLDRRDSFINTYIKSPLTTIANQLREGKSGSSAITETIQSFGRKAGTLIHDNLPDNKDSFLGRLGSKAKDIADKTASLQLSDGVSRKADTVGHFLSKIPGMPTLIDMIGGDTAFKPDADTPGALSPPSALSGATIPSQIDGVDGILPFLKEWRDGQAKGSETLQRAVDSIASILSKRTESGYDPGGRDGYSTASRRKRRPVNGTTRPRSVETPKGSTVPHPADLEVSNTLVSAAQAEPHTPQTTSAGTPSTTPTSRSAWSPSSGWESLKRASENLKAHIDARKAERAQRKHASDDALHILGDEVAETTDAHDPKIEQAELKNIPKHRSTLFRRTVPKLAENVGASINRIYKAATHSDASRNESTEGSIPSPRESRLKTAAHVIGKLGAVPGAVAGAATGALHSYRQRKMSEYQTSPDEKPKGYQEEAGHTGGGLLGTLANVANVLDTAIDFLPSKKTVARTAKTGARITSRMGRRLGRTIATARGEFAKAAKSGVKLAAPKAAGLATKGVNALLDGATAGSFLASMKSARDARRAWKGAGFFKRLGMVTKGTKTAGGGVLGSAAKTAAGVGKGYFKVGAGAARLGGKALKYGNKTLNAIDDYGTPIMKHMGFGRMAKSSRAGVRLAGKMGMNLPRAIKFLGKGSVIGAGLGLAGEGVEGLTALATGGNISAHPIIGRAGASLGGGLTGAGVAMTLAPIAALLGLPFGLTEIAAIGAGIGVLLANTDMLGKATVAAGHAGKYLYESIVGRKPKIDQNGNIIEPGKNGVIANLNTALFGRAAGYDAKGTRQTEARLGMLGEFENGLRKMFGQEPLTAEQMWGKKKFEDGAEAVHTIKPSELTPITGNGYTGPTEMATESLMGNGRPFNPAATTYGPHSAYTSASIMGAPNVGINAPTTPGGPALAEPGGLDDQPRYQKILNSLPKGDRSTITTSDALKYAAWSTGMAIDDPSKVSDMLKQASEGKDATPEDILKKFFKLRRDHLSDSNTNDSIDKVNKEEAMATSILQKPGQYNFNDMKQSVGAKDDNGEEYKKWFNTLNGGNLPAGNAYTSKSFLSPQQSHHNAQIAVQYLQNKYHLPPTTIAAILGNAMGESGLNPGIPGDKSKPGGSLGIFQWRDFRRAPIEKHFGKSIADMSLEEQLDAFMWDASHVYGGQILNTVMQRGAQNDLSGAVSVLVSQFERPKNPGPDTAKRIAYAQPILKGILDGTYGSSKPASDAATPTTLPGASGSIGTPNQSNGTALASASTPITPPMGMPMASAGTSGTTDTTPPSGGGGSATPTAMPTSGGNPLPTLASAKPSNDNSAAPAAASATPSAGSASSAPSTLPQVPVPTAPLPAPVVTVHAGGNQNDVIAAIRELIPHLNDIKTSITDHGDKTTSVLAQGQGINMNIAPQIQTGGKSNTAWDEDIHLKQAT